MSKVVELTFPPLLHLDEFGGDFPSYFKAVYAVFENDFVRSNPHFNGMKVSAQRQPLVDGIHRTFYHITHEGEDETNRSPDFRRMERIRFPKFIIEACPHDNLLIWKNQRNRDTRILIFNQTESYLVVLTERGTYCLFWTAYYIKQSHRKKKLLKEYQAYIKTETAQGF